MMKMSDASKSHVTVNQNSRLEKQTKQMESALNLKWFSEWTNKKKGDKNH